MRTHLLCTALALSLLLGCGSEAPKPAPGSGSAAGSSATAPSAGLELINGGTLRVAIEFGYLPFEMKTSTGEAIGFDVELARAIGKQLGCQVAFVPTEWDNIIAALQTKKVDCIISGMSITEERREKIDFSTPYYKVGQAVLIQKKDAGTFKKVADLNKKGMLVTTQNGTTGDKAAREFCPEATIKPYDKQIEAAMEVAGGRAHGMIFDHPFIAIFAMRNKATCSALLEQFTKEDIGIAVRKKTPKLLAALDAALGALAKDGTLDALEKKYFVDMPWLDQIPSK